MEGKKLLISALYPATSSYTSLHVRTRQEPPGYTKFPKQEIFIDMFYIKLRKMETLVFDKINL